MAVEKHIFREHYKRYRDQRGRNSREQEVFTAVTGKEILFLIPVKLPKEEVGRDGSE